MNVARGPRVVAAEVSLLGVSAAVGFGATRLFEGSSWMWPVLLTIALVHGLSAIARRNHFGIPLQVLVVGVAEGLLLAALFAGETFAYVLPTGETLSTLRTALDAAISAYPTARAPVPVTDGFVIAFCIGLAIVAVMADIAAFTLRAPLQALIPPFTLFVLCSLLGSGQGRTVSALAFLVASLAFVLTVRGLENATSTTWMPGDQARGPNALLRLGSGLIAVAAFAALLIGPALPGAADAGLWTWRGGSGPDSRVVISPLVDLKARLVNQSRQIAFIVESPQPAYWRLGSLDEFDGRRWTSSSTFRPVDGDFNVRVADGAATDVVQEFEIRDLGRNHLPAAYEPIAVEAPNGTITFDDRSASLLLDEELRQGFTYAVTSRVPSYTPEELRAADDHLPTAVERRYLALPELDPRVHDLAEEVTAGATTRYDQALALQDFFRGSFEYSVDIDGGSDEDALVRFLFDERAGYCEQFAASFAAMARSLGIPTRLAIGFTEGDQSPNRPELFTVRGANAHTWPEVYFRNVGWVTFEPTPGRVAPGSAAWTNLDDASDTGAEPDEPEDTTNDSVAPTIPQDLEPMLPEFDLGQGGGVSAADDGGIPTPLRVLLGAVAAVALWFAAVLSLAGLRRARRRHQVAHDPGARTELAWNEAVEALARRGRVPRVSETRSEYAARVAVSNPSAAEPLAELATLSATARYSAEVPEPDDVERAIERSASVVHASTSHLPWYRRTLIAGDPRRLVTPSPRRARRSATVVSTA